MLIFLAWVTCGKSRILAYYFDNSIIKVVSKYALEISLFPVVFMCLISPTQKFKLEKNTLNTKEWGKSRFDEILELWIFILDYFVAPAFCLIPVS